MRACRIVLLLTIVIGKCSFSLAANRVEVQSTTILANECSTGEIRISIENDVDLHSVSIPLVIRSILGMQGYWTSLELPPSTGRLATSLTGIQVLESGRSDFVSPDQVALYFEATDASDCLPAGPNEVMTGITFKNNGFEGLLEIDTALYPPCYSPVFTACSDQAPVAWDEFVSGYITLFTPPSSYCDNVTIHIDSTSLLRWSGTAVVNDADYTNAVGETLKFLLVSGPGEVDSLTGNWHWESSPSQNGLFDVSIAVYSGSCPSIQCMPVTFSVQLQQPVPGDLNCDGIVNIVDVVREVGHAFRNEPPPTPCWDL